MGKFVYEHKTVRHVPAGKASLQKSAEFATIHYETIFQYDKSQWALLPFTVRHSDDCCFPHRLVCNQRVFQVDGANPLPAGLDQVLQAIGDFQVAFGINRAYVAGAEPAIGGPLVSLIEVVVAACNPWPTDLQVARGYTVSGTLTLVADGAQSLIREQVEMGVAVRMAVLEALAQNIPNA